MAQRLSHLHLATWIWVEMFRAQRDLVFLIKTLFGQNKLSRPRLKQVTLNPKFRVPIITKLHLPATIPKPHGQLY